MAKLHFTHSVMNAGKSTALLQARHNYVENGGRVMLFTSLVDDRAGIGRISSRMGIAADAHALSGTDDLFAIVAAEHALLPITCVMIDEAQFLSANHVWQAARVVDELGVPVMAYGLKNNVFGEIFGPAVAALLALSDDIKELKQLCHCGRKATMILRYGPDGVAVKEGDVVEVGGDNRYVSVCRPHWMAGDIGPTRRGLLRIACDLAVA